MSVGSVGKSLCPSRYPKACTLKGSSKVILQIPDKINQVLPTSQSIHICRITLVQLFNSFLCKSTCVQRNLLVLQSAPIEDNRASFILLQGFHTAIIDIRNSRFTRRLQRKVCLTRSALTSDAC